MTFISTQIDPVQIDKNVGFIWFNDVCDTATTFCDSIKLFVNPAVNPAIVNFAPPPNFKPLEFNVPPTSAFATPNRKITVHGTIALGTVLLAYNITDIVIVSFNFTNFDENSAVDMPAGLQNVNDVIWYLNKLNINVYMDDFACTRLLHDAGNPPAAILNTVPYLKKVCDEAVALTDASSSITPAQLAAGITATTAPAPATTTSTDTGFNSTLIALVVGLIVLGALAFFVTGQSQTA